MALIGMVVELCEWCCYCGWFAVVIGSSTPVESKEEKKSSKHTQVCIVCRRVC